MMTYETTINNNNLNTEKEHNQTLKPIEMIETANAAPDWREFLETQEFYLEAVGN